MEVHSAVTYRILVVVVLCSHQQQQDETDIESEPRGCCSLTLTLVSLCEIGG